ncbi:MAG: hypothetical protein ABSF95_00365 [Verrucomicrobiota bacterium]
MPQAAQTNPGPATCWRTRPARRRHQNTRASGKGDADEHCSLVQDIHKNRVQECGRSHGPDFINGPARVHVYSAARTRQYCRDGSCRFLKRILGRF